MDRTIEGNIVDVVAGEVFPGRIVHGGGIIRAVVRARGPFRGFLVPGFIDAHVHIDSSLLCPSRFAEAVVPRGTTAVVTDPHEIANVAGMAGIAFMRGDAAGAPLRCFFTAPSCVPATPFETAGASLGPGEVAALLREEDVVALGEVMNYAGAIAGAPDILEKIAAARAAGKPVDGHAPLLRGERLRAYVARGISSDHECVGADEALEKHLLGMRIFVREGSAARNLEALAPFARGHDFCLVSDDRIASDLSAGHLDDTLAKAVAMGIDPMHALRAVTIRPAEHYRLPLGAIEKGRRADVARVSDLSTFAVEEVLIGGEVAASGGRASFAPCPEAPASAIRIAKRRAEDFAVPAAGGETARARVIRLVPGEIVTESETAVLRVARGAALPDPAGDVLLIAVVKRYVDSPVRPGFVSGFGLREGAIASSVAHDSHNIVVVGASPGDMAEAVNAVVDASGGLCVAAGGRAEVLPLPVAGLMSLDPPADVARRLNLLQRRARLLGCLPDNPFMTMSFLSLLVVPRLKIGDRGLFDVEDSRFVAPVQG